MNSLIKLDNYHVCSVKYLPDLVKQLSGIVVCGPDTAKFHYRQSHDVVVEDRELWFGDGKPVFTKVGDEIVAQVEHTDEEGFKVTAWTNAKDFEAGVAKQKQLKAEAETPKPAPSLPVAPALIIVQPDKVNKTGQDRRKIFKPTARKTTAKKTTKKQTTAEQPLPFEQQLEAAATEQAAAERKVAS